MVFVFESYDNVFFGVFVLLLSSKFNVFSFSSLFCCCLFRGLKHCGMAKIDDISFNEANNISIDMAKANTWKIWHEKFDRKQQKSAQFQVSTNTMTTCHTIATVEQEKRKPHDIYFSYRKALLINSSCFTRKLCSLHWVNRNENDK